MLSKSAQTDDIQRFTELASAFTEPGDKEKADAVLQVSVAANRKNYDKVRRTSDMCEALRELMKEEIEEELKKNREQGRINQLIDLVMQNLLPIETAAQCAKMTLDEFISSTGVFGELSSITNPIMNLFILVMMGYAVIKCFFANLKRGGILLIQIAVGSLYMFSVPRGYMDGFVQWCKQIIGLCLTTFLQTTILSAGLLVLREHALLGLGLMLSAGEVPRICGAFGLDTSTRANVIAAVNAAQTAVNTTRTVVQVVGAAK